METLLVFIGVIGNIISVLMFASPIKTFWRIVKNKSTEDFEPTPYVVTLLGSCLWVYYGLTKPDGLLVATVNAVGIFLEAIYVLLFLFFSSSPSIRMKTIFLVIILDIFFGLVFFTTQFLMDGSLRLTIVGIICTCLNILMYGSPLMIMKTVINTKSVEYMPFFLSFFLFLNGGVWALYAILDHDVYLTIPNGMGFILGTLQLMLYMIYMNPKAKVDKQSGEERWQQHQSLLIDPNESIERDQEQG
ncbi:LOW QUALITY PROTEIN: bidirectional sugar transporter SWEET16-like [Dioscorea cayenensis subsp. rotundata]|uniref:Bidirectional sugar transporter SWEET n=1 Tax=Dioscorea cayennensis subsp. rotundata TaxID=55577 RepID=A0AB40AWE4_DIOCR|nr:LOW QUALITY PROTEIN: bidirectional sugar transporter SWEET16-like [Dioscorea cayenensis subsp. rotundata]